MLNSCWRVWVGGGGGPVVGRGWKGRGWRRLRHYNEPQLFYAADPRGWSAAPVLFSHPRCLSISLLSPPHVPHPFPLPRLGLLSLSVLPFGFSLSFYFHPCPSLFFSLSLSVFDFHSPSAAQGMFSFQMRAKKSCDKVVCECVFVCVCVCALGLSVRELHRILISSRNLFRLKQLNNDAVYLIFFNASVENMSVGLMYVSCSSQCVGVRADVQHCPVNKNSHTSNNLVGQLWRNYSRCHVH